jgi:hypothetical protein
MVRLAGSPTSHAIPFFGSYPVPSSFALAESGRFVPRRRTRLPAKVHRHLARQVKVARIMGLLNPTSKYRRESLWEEGEDDGAGAAGAEAKA